MTAAISAKISRLTRHDDAAFDALVVIYQASIERSEQKPVEALRRAVDDSRYRFLVARDGDAVIGFAICYAPAPEGMWLLEYMATDATRRSSGLGAALLQACIDLHRAAGRPIGLLEVDAVSGDAMLRDQRMRRLAFYRRNGCRMIDGLDYILPLPGAPAMRLLVHAPAGVETLDKAELEIWIAAIYREVYAQAANDPRPARMVAPLPDPARLCVIDETSPHA